MQPIDMKLIHTRTHSTEDWSSRSCAEHAFLCTQLTLDLQATMDTVISTQNMDFSQQRIDMYRNYKELI